MFHPQFLFKGGNKVTTDSILMLDCRKEENKAIIQKALRKIKPLMKYEEVEEDIPLEMIEKVINVITGKYCVCIQWISHQKQPLFTNDNSVWWSCSCKTDDDHKWIGTWYGATMYELLAKTALRLYVGTLKEEFRKRDMKKEEEKKKRLAQWNDDKENDDGEEW
jgi:hypothetical protein